MKEFFDGINLERRVEILRRHEVDYVMVRSNSRLGRTMDELPGFDPLQEPSKRYNLYAVDLRRLGGLVDNVE